MNRVVASRLVALSIGLATADPGVAHDFWLQPARFQLAAQEPVSLTLLVGHGVDRERSAIPLARIVRFMAIGSRGADDRLSDLHRGGDDDARIALLQPGTYVLALQTDDRAESRLDADRFNAYLDDEGLTPAQALRTRLRRDDTEGAERYSRCAKALVRMGEKGDDPAADVSAPIGLPLEIVLDDDPYRRPRPDRLGARVFYEGSPLAGALVKLNDLDHDAHPVAMHRTDADGRVAFAMPADGQWQLNVIWTKPTSRDRAVDFETVFSSLSFGWR